MLKDYEDPHNFSLKIGLLEFEFDTSMSKEDAIATLSGSTGAKDATMIHGKQKLIKNRG